MSRGRNNHAGGRGGAGDSDQPRPKRRRKQDGEMIDEPTGQRQRSTVQPDELDLQIIALLRVDGRRSNREVARRLGVPEATVRYRVRRLTESGVLKIAASVDPEHLGYALTAVIAIEVDPRMFVEVSDKIAAMEQVMWLGITTGASDIILTASFRHQDEMFAFVADDLAHIDGVKRVQTSVCMRVVKKSNQWSTDLTSAIAPDLDEGSDEENEVLAKPARRTRRRAAVASTA
jgi:Lrp/AsnC family transcriptional regulator, regulator for asnA, asnC and gidA